MAALLKALFLLPLFFVSGSAFLPILDMVLGLDNGGNAGGPQNPAANAAEKPDFETNYLGDWKIHSPNAGVSAMQMQLLPTNKVVMYDAASLGPSSIQLAAGNCRPFPQWPDVMDCWAHAVEYDVETAEVRPLKVLTDTWCSSGGLTTDGSLISTGGFKDGGQAVRLLSTCTDCDWKENPTALKRGRWYSTQEKLEDGNFILFGGRLEFNYEYVQNSLNFPKRMVNLPFLKATSDPYENNLYPFAHLLPDGTVFLLANRRSIILDPKTDTVVRELPVLPGGSRNYPASGMSALLPLKLAGNNPNLVNAEILVCGGAKPGATEKVDKAKILLPALTDCGRIAVTNPKAQWEMDLMPSRRVMGDMLLLPNGEVLILSGAKAGVSGWQMADDPNFTPLLYSPKKKHGQRFKQLKATNIARMYHSSAAVLPDGKILVGGSNTNPSYNFTNLVKYRTELRVEKFSPHYLDPLLDQYRPEIIEGASDEKLAYGQEFAVNFKLNVDGVGPKDIKVTMYSPPFTTHGYSQNQRLIVLDAVEVVNGRVTAVAPPSGKIAPPGYYLLFVVHRAVPSRGMWVQIQ